MDIIFWRHAEAKEPGDEGLDLDRPLTSKGEKQAARMAAWLNRQMPEATKIWVSPALRTVQTAISLDRKYKIRDELAPDGSVQGLLSAIHWPSIKSTALVIGHQPLIGKTIAQLLGLPTQEINLKKGAVWWLRYRERAGVGETVVVTVQTPELL
jgi:phosphohistidine phosphatase